MGQCWNNNHDRSPRVILFSSEIPSDNVKRSSSPFRQNKQSNCCGIVLFSFFLKYSKRKCIWIDNIATLYIGLACRSSFLNMKAITFSPLFLFRLELRL